MTVSSEAHGNITDELKLMFKQANISDHVGSIFSQAMKRKMRNNYNSSLICANLFNDFIGHIHH